MKLLALDIGNTHVKCGIYEKKMGGNNKDTFKFKFLGFFLKNKKTLDKYSRPFLPPPPAGRFIFFSILNNYIFKLYFYSLIVKLFYYILYLYRQTGGLTSKL